MACAAFSASLSSPSLSRNLLAPSSWLTRHSVHPLPASRRQSLQQPLAMADPREGKHVNSMNRYMSIGPSDVRAVQDRADGVATSLEWKRTKEHLEQLQLDISRLSVIHVAGTKGKGSTCSMVESILRSKGYRTGLYTSPHLIDVRERVRINGDPLPHAEFCRYFWEVHDALKMFSDDEQNESQMPGYFRFLTVLAFKIFLTEPIDVAIVEVGLGGRFDATNIVAPVACGITSLGFDHTNVLGNTIEEIAFQKAVSLPAFVLDPKPDSFFLPPLPPSSSNVRELIPTGILKPGVLSFTSPQRPNAMRVLEQEAQKVGCPLLEVPPMSKFTRGNEANALDIGLKGEVQDINAGLAVALSNAWLARNQAKPPRREDLFVVSEGFREGLRGVRMLGRCQRLVFAPRSGPVSGNVEVSYYLDGAHTLESVECGAHWYESNVGSAQRSDVQQAANILVFYCSGDRDYKSLLEPLIQLNKHHPFSKALTRPLSLQEGSLGGEGVLGRAQVTSLVDRISSEANDEFGLAADSSWDLRANGDQLFAQQQRGEASGCSGSGLAGRRREYSVYITGSLLLCGDTLEELLSRTSDPVQAKEWILKFSQ
ncbi:hypothetical protein GUITHDRAFT_134142 [Guillardia theta CCMP2712]|uniref:tetrahydrofolate synthase n=1 Tax=Guillardia theta (strain CCMP2712) TaxID=905079 RepID=L1JTC0_GUITC|nr:hypothetical protein GUITHDRAFT_134142 [Guillardia theta CCMP2712]EKX51786.1 hypothetical protein GUITHDRAFT_134142 [Guillardia theta CCMP2712]|eukprot:XP_005838766.1 hypothetical protein GUITHDRAFT_134142 [Guillardia theta CCMP2712]